MPIERMHFWDGNKIIELFDGSYRDIITKYCGEECYDEDIFHSEIKVGDVDVDEIMKDISKIEDADIKTVYYDDLYEECSKKDIEEGCLEQELTDEQVSTIMGLILERKKQVARENLRRKNRGC